MSRKYLEIRWKGSFSGRTKVSPPILILQMLSPFMNSKFFQKNFGARRARAKLRALAKRAHFSSVAKSGRNKKIILQKCGEWQKKIIGLTKFFL